MAALVLRNDLQTTPDCESQQGNEGVLEADAIHVVGTGLRYQLPHDLVTPKERFEDIQVDLFGRVDFLGRPSPRAPRIRCNVVSNEPAGEPAGSDFKNRRTLPPFQCC